MMPRPRGAATLLATLLMAIGFTGCSDDSGQPIKTSETGAMRPTSAHGTTTLTAAPGLKFTAPPDCLGLPSRPLAVPPVF
ncbi:MAG: hypothetical protein ABSH28_07475 [Acidobacteriota bacterium]|jgi:hypothetical protein